MNTDTFLIPGLFGNNRRLWVVMRCETDRIKLKTWWAGNSEPMEWTQEGPTGAATDPRYLVFTNRTTGDDLGGDVWVNSICMRAGASCSNGLCGCGPEPGQFTNHILVGSGDGASTQFAVAYASGYEPGSLVVNVDGLEQNVTEDDPDSGQFSLDFAPESDETIWASWRVR